MPLSQFAMFRGYQYISWVLFKLMLTNPFFCTDQNEPFQKTTITLRANHAFHQFELINCRAAQSFINAQHPFASDTDPRRPGTPRLTGVKSMLGI